MNFLVTIITSLVLVVKISYSHKVLPAIIVKSNSGDVPFVNPNNKIFPKVIHPVTHKPKLCESAIINTNKSIESLNTDELVFAHVVSEYNQRVCYELRTEKRLYDFDFIISIADVSTWGG